MLGWRDLWEERGKYYPCDDLAKVDGFDHAAGKLNEEQVNFLVERIRHVLNLTDKDLLLEASLSNKSIE